MYNQKAHVHQPWVAKKGSQKSNVSPLLHTNLVVPKLWASALESSGKTQPSFTLNDISRATCLCAVYSFVFWMIDLEFWSEYCRHLKLLG